MNKIKFLVLSVLIGMFMVVETPNAKAVGDCIQNVIVNFDMQQNCPSGPLGFTTPTIGLHPGLNCPVEILAPRVFGGYCAIAGSLCEEAWSTWYRYTSGPGLDGRYCCYSTAIIIGMVTWDEICGTNTVHKSRAMRLPVNCFAVDIVMSTTNNLSTNCPCMVPSWCYKNATSCLLWGELVAGRDEQTVAAFSAAIEQGVFNEQDSPSVQVTEEESPIIESDHTLTFQELVARTEEIIANRKH